MSSRRRTFLIACGTVAPIALVVGIALAQGGSAPARPLPPVPTVAEGSNDSGSRAQEAAERIAAADETTWRDQARAPREKARIDACTGKPIKPGTALRQVTDKKVDCARPKPPQPKRHRSGASAGAHEALDAIDYECGRLRENRDVSAVHRAARFLLAEASDRPTRELVSLLTGAAQTELDDCDDLIGHGDDVEQLLRAADRVDDRTRSHNRFIDG